MRATIELPIPYQLRHGEPSPLTHGFHGTLNPSFESPRLIHTRRHVAVILLRDSV